MLVRGGVHWLVLVLLLLLLLLVLELLWRK